MEIHKGKARIILDDGKEYLADIIEDNMGAKSLDISTLRKNTGFITYDPGYMNTGSCTSSICYINGEEGILRYRGYDVADLVDNCDFIEVAYLMVKGHLPNKEERIKYQDLLNQHSLLHYNMKQTMRTYPSNAHPMSILAAMVSSLSAFYPEMTDMEPEENIDLTVTRLLSKMRTIAAYTYRQMNGLEFIDPKEEYSYCENFLNMFFYTPVNRYVPNPVHVRALNKLLIMHADHEQNCSTSAVRLVGSADANLYASVAAGCCALWGPKHGGANMEVMNMLSRMANEKISVDEVLEKAKDKNDPFRLYGFGHRVYKTFDPRARIAKRLCMEVMASSNYRDPLLDIALELEEKATKDEYFTSRHLYPNIDFYTGLTFRMLGIPQNMYTVLFAMGRLPGWIAHYLEWYSDPMRKIGRPRQVYSGETLRRVTPIYER